MSIQGSKIIFKYLKNLIKKRLCYNIIFTMRIILILCSLISLACSWRESEIMAITAVARRVLKEQDLYSYYHFEKLVKSINGLVNNASQTFLQASCWPLDIERNGFGIWNSWQYSNTPIQTFTSPKNFTPQINETRSYYSITRTLTESLSVLSSNRNRKLAQTGLFSRFLINLVAEIHHPLNCGELYNETFPAGDLGGRRMRVRVMGGNGGAESSVQRSLSELWEAVFVEMEVGDVLKGIGRTRPLSQADLQQYYGKIAQHFTKDNQTLNPDQLNNLNPQSWASQSLEIASKQIYPFFTKTNILNPNQKASLDYINRAKAILKERILLAGYRLARLISGVYRAGLDENRRGLRLRRPNVITNFK